MMVEVFTASFFLFLQGNFEMFGWDIIDYRYQSMIHDEVEVFHSDIHDGWILVECLRLTTHIHFETLKAVFFAKNILLVNNGAVAGSIFCWSYNLGGCLIQAWIIVSLDSRLQLFLNNKDRKNNRHNSEDFFPKKPSKSWDDCKKRINYTTHTHIYIYMHIYIYIFACTYIYCIYIYMRNSSIIINNILFPTELSSISTLQHFYLPPKKPAVLHWTSTPPPPPPVLGKLQNGEVVCNEGPCEKHQSDCNVAVLSM